MTNDQMFDYLGSESTPENVKEFYGNMTQAEILASMNETWPSDNNSDLAEKVYDYCRRN